MLVETEKQRWPFVPLVSVGPLPFGMSRDQVVDQVAVTLGACPNAEAPGDWITFSDPNSFARPLTTYFSAAGGLACVAVDARHGPQITLGHLNLVGQVPSNEPPPRRGGLRRHGRRRRLDWGRTSAVQGPGSVGIGSPEGGWGASVAHRCHHQAVEGEAVRLPGCYSEGRVLRCVVGGEAGCGDVAGDGQGYRVVEGGS